jgi:serine/threonine protein phosphatase PrpC
MSTHWRWCRVCMQQIRDMKLLCCDGLWRHLDTESLNANLVHLVGTAVEVQWTVRRLSIAY